MKSYNLRNQSVTLTKNQYNQNMEQFLSWFIGPWSQTLIFQNSSFCSFYYISYPTIWGIWDWLEFWIFLRLKENKEIPHFVGFLAHQNPTIWGIWNWIEFRRFLRLEEVKETPHSVGFFGASKSYNVRNLNLKWKLNIPQNVGYWSKFLTLYVFWYN